MKRWLAVALACIVSILLYWLIDDPEWKQRVGGLSMALIFTCVVHVDVLWGEHQHHAA